MVGTVDVDPGMTLAWAYHDYIPEDYDKDTYVLEVVFTNWMGSGLLGCVRVNMDL